MIYSIKVLLYRPIGACLTLFRSLKRKYKLSPEPRLFLLNIPSHGNLGDHLISVAEQEFLSDYFPNKKIVLVSSADLFFSITFALFDVRKIDVLCVTGGGFLGSLYDEENRFLRIIKRFSDNRLVFFPQSIYYESNEKGKRKLDKASSIYSHRDNLFIAARDKSTFKLLSETMMPNHREQIALIPDIAIYKHYSSLEKRESVLWCIRNDAESLGTNRKNIEYIHKVLSNKHLGQKYTDTYVNRAIPLSKEYEEVESKLKEFSSARLVITDRLHGMIYSVITNTPVIVLDNVNHKVSQVYDLWLKSIPFVKFVRDETCIEEIINELLTVNHPVFDNNGIKELFKPIIKAIEA